MAPLAEPREHAAVAFFQGKIFVAGGSCSGSNISTIEVFKSDAYLAYQFESDWTPHGQWTRIENLTHVIKCRYAKARMTAGRCLYITGE